MIRTPEQKKKNRRALRFLVLISQLGICMLVPLFICVFLGQWISERTGQLILFPLMLLIGILAGFRSVWYMISRFTGLLPPDKIVSGRRTGRAELPGRGINKEGPESPAAEGQDRSVEDRDEMDREDPQGQ